ncbi:MAG TPA: hypothetical protein VK890_11155, partial [Bacteroidia bacterium]|nr:hypothetical protein [Bacteroidia bacterium]
MRPKALFILTPGFAASETDSTCIPALQQFCLSLKNIAPGISIVIFAFQYPFNPCSYQWNGINVIAFGGKNSKGFSRITLWLKIAAGFLAMRKNYDAVGIFSIWLTECALVGKILARWCALKHYIWIMGQDARSTNKYVKLVHPRPENLIAHSKFISAQMESNFSLLPAHIIG